MRVYFCAECGAYYPGSISVCEECKAELPGDSWAEVTDEELRQLEYVDEFDLPPWAQSWEYDVVRLRVDEEAGGLGYTAQVLKRMGQRGWELVGIVPVAGDDGLRFGVFKRAWGGDSPD